MQNLAHIIQDKHQGKMTETHMPVSHQGKPLHLSRLEEAFTRQASPVFQRWDNGPDTLLKICRHILDCGLVPSLCNQCEPVGSYGSEDGRAPEAARGMLKGMPNTSSPKPVRTIDVPCLNREPCPTAAQASGSQDETTPT